MAQDLARDGGRRAGQLAELADEGLRGGFLHALPPAAAERLLEGAIRINVPAGSLVYRDEEAPQLLVVATGLLRVFVSSSDGRQVTVRYVRSGDVAGLALVLGGPAPMGIQAMTPALLVALRTATLRAMLERDPGVARACAAELARQVQGLLIDVAEQAFLSVRQRLVRELLVLAARGPGRHLVVTASQQDLADGIGSVREVVARTLHVLQEDGLVRIGRGGVELLDPMGLTDELGPRATAGIE